MHKAMIWLCLLLLPALVWAGTLVDDFSDANYDGWLQGDVSEPGSTWVVEDGVLVGTRANGWGSGVTIGEPSWKDVTIEYDAKMTATFGSTYGIGVVLRTQDLNMHNGATFWIAQWGTRGKLAVWIVIHQLNFVREITQPFPVELHRWYHLKGSVSGSRYRFYVDGELLMDFEDNRYDSGRVSLIISGSTTLCDNVVITGDDVPDMNLSVEPAGKLAATWGRVKAF